MISLNVSKHNGFEMKHVLCLSTNCIFHAFTIYNSTFTKDIFNTPDRNAHENEYLHAQVHIKMLMMVCDFYHFQCVCVCACWTARLRSC